MISKRLTVLFRRVGSEGQIGKSRRRRGTMYIEEAPVTIRMRRTPIAHMSERGDTGAVLGSTSGAM